MTPFSRYLEALRRSRNLQQKQLADRLGVNASYVSSLMTGKKRPPSRQVLLQIVSKFELSEAEEVEMWRTVALSELNLRLPTNMCEEEFEFVYELRGRLGTLSANQLCIMRKTLELGIKQA